MLHIYTAILRRKCSMNVRSQQLNTSILFTGCNVSSISHINTRIGERFEPLISFEMAAIQSLISATWKKQLLVSTGNIWFEKICKCAKIQRNNITKAVLQDQAAFGVQSVCPALESPEVCGVVHCGWEEGECGALWARRGRSLLSRTWRASRGKSAWPPRQPSRLAGPAPAAPPRYRRDPSAPPRDADLERSGTTQQDTVFPQGVTLKHTNYTTRCECD